MTTLKGTLIDVANVPSKTNTTTGQITPPKLILSVMAKFRNFGNTVPKIIEINQDDVSKFPEYQSKIGKEIEVSFFMDLPKFPLQVVNV